MKHRLLIVAAWFPVTFLLLIINLAMLSQYNDKTTVGMRLNATAPSENFQLAAGGTSQIVKTNIFPGDARTLLVESFFEKHKSPMTPYAETVVTESDRLGIDFRLLPAIAMCESNAGKRMPKKKEFNFAGIAVYTGQNYGKAFDSWPHAITWVAQYVKEHYYDRGYTDLKDIGAIWAPPSVENGYSWTNCVQGFMDQII